MKFILKLIFVFFVLEVTKSDECGTRRYSQPTIYGGENAEPGEWPWFARLFRKTTQPPFLKFFCGASLISEQHLLTGLRIETKAFFYQYFKLFVAAHCMYITETRIIQKELIVAMLGGLDISNLNDKRWIRREISKMHLHPDFYSDTQSMLKRFDADIAVLKLSSLVTKNSLTQVICLPSARATIDGTYGTIVGHGPNEMGQLEDIPKFINISAISWQECIFKDDRYVNYLSNRGFCAGEIGKIPCSGDSGGGFYVYNNNRWQIYGIVSAALTDDYGQCDATKRTIFTNIANFIDWVKDKIAKKRYM